MERFFAAVSFQPGARPAYDRLVELFVPGGTLVDNTPESIEVCTVPDFVRPREDMVRRGALTAFHEAEEAYATVVVGRLAHRSSVYRKRAVRDGTVLEARGWISTQLLLSPAGWRISSMAWEDERPGVTLPDP
jgi:hypothetical protein